ncbi:sialic acid-binding Ig-like lectin 16 [Orycteropus afer afer]|uniref:Sialic acid-binding Ig-like lectin 16 n=1 Tax=Orycteropus afer afer TaxID=1230840 RepID=A0AC54ZF32_ORYAF|nr:sialic acid-binding Ig-like lectin 16 [Orycteropus afer afer]
MLPLLLLPLLWGGSLQQDEGFELQVPERVTVQEGLCVLVPCTFLYPGKSPWDSSPLYISWFWSGDRIQYDPPVVTNNPNRWVKTETRGRFHLLGDPMTNSCTLSIRDAKKRDTGTYIFHIERDYYEKHTYQQKTLNVQVTGPQPRDQRFQLEVQSSVAVPEGLCAHVPCSVSYPPDGWADADPALGYWFREGAARDAAPRPPVATNDPHREVAKETRGRFQLLGDPRTGGCSLVIRDVRRADAGTYFFRVERGSYVRFNYIDSKLSLEVTDRRQVPDVYMPEALEPGRPATLLCVFHWAFEGCPAPTFSWRGAAADGRAAGPRTSHVLSELTFTPRAQDHGTELTCRVDFSGTRVSAERTVRLNVAHAPKDLVINVSWAKTSDPAPQGNNSCLQVWRGQFLRLSCEADGQPPATLGWVLNDRVLARSPPSGSRTLELELPRVGPGDGGRYTCRAENRLGSLQAWLDLSVQYPPENLRVTVSQANRTVLENFESGMSVSVLEGESLRLVCVADSNPLAALSWARGRPALSPSQPSGPGVLELPRVQKDDEGEFTCRAQNSLGSASISVRLVVFYPPQLRGPACSWEGVGLRCGCSARAWPAPSVRWRVGDELLEANSSNASVTVTSSSAGPWANSSLRLRAGPGSILRLGCEAWNGRRNQSVSVLLLPGKSSPKTEMLLGALVGVGAMALFSLCVCLAFYCM